MQEFFPEAKRMNPLLTKLKMLLGIKDESRSELLSFLIEETTDKICNYCNIEKVPKELETTLLSMCIRLYRTENLGQEETKREVKSMSEGAVSVSFDSAINENQGKAMDFLEDYTNQLNKYRKVGW